MQGSWHTWAIGRPAEPNTQAEEVLPPVVQAERGNETHWTQPATDEDVREYIYIYVYIYIYLYIDIDIDMEYGYRYMYIYIYIYN